MAALIPKPLTGRHVLIITVLFFLVVIAFDGLLIYLGLSTHPGTVSDRAYQEGLDYNRRIEAARAQAERGWQIATMASVLERDGAARVLRLDLEAKDAAGRPLPGLLLSAEFVRPVTTGLDRQIRLNEAGEGAYVGIVRLPAAGRWQLAVTTVGPKQPPFRYREDLVLE